MLFMVVTRDKADSVQLRMDTRPAHLEYLNSAGDRVKLAGPIMSTGDEPQPIGSVILIDAASEGAAKIFADNDPYTLAGLFENVEILPWRAALGNWKPAE